MALRLPLQPLLQIFTGFHLGFARECAYLHESIQTRVRYHPRHNRCRLLRTQEHGGSDISAAC
jgi:hypothetical protein